MSERVVIERQDTIAEVRLNRPDKHNALDWAMFKAIAAAGRSLRGDRGLRCVVIHGAGPSFCSGLDFPSFMGTPEALTEGFAPVPGEIANFAQSLAYNWKQLEVPVIAAIHGAAFGGGLQLALAADIRLGTPDSRYSVMEMKYGLIPDMTATQTLRDLVRLDVAKELVFSGRIVPAVEAAELGLVTRVVDDPLAAARAMAQEIASKSPDAIRASKQLLEAAWRADAATGLALEAKLQAQLLGSPNQLEAVRAGLQKRDAQFKIPE